MSEPLWQPRTDLAARLLGAGFFTGGVALVAYQVKVILDSVSSQADRVTYFMAAFALGTMGIVLGAYWLIRGLAGYASIRALQTDRRRMRVFSIVAAVILIAGTIGLKFWIASFGYEN